MYVNCFPLHFCCLQLVTKAMLLYNSAICDLLRESIQIMKILIHLKVVILVSEKWNEHNLMYIDHKQCEIMQKIQWNSSKANFTDFPLTDGAVVTIVELGNQLEFSMTTDSCTIFHKVQCNNICLKFRFSKLVVYASACCARSTSAQSLLPRGEHKMTPQHFAGIFTIGR